MRKAAEILVASLICLIVIPLKLYNIYQDAKFKYKFRNKKFK